MTPLRLPVLPSLLFVAAFFAAPGLRPGTASPSHEKRDGIATLDVWPQENTLDLLLTVRAGEAHRLVHRRSNDGGASWSEDHVIETGPSGLYPSHRGNDPQVVAHGQTVLVVWTRPGTSRFGSGPLGTALSLDGGRTWVAGPNPADDGSTGGHGYVDAAAGPDGGFYLAWLDSRDGGQGLRAAASRDGGRTWSRNSSVDTRTCECCWNTLLAPRTDAALLLYRDKDPRDMAVAATIDGGRTWTRRAAVGRFDWAFDGCPHVGGALGATGEGRIAKLHALSWTGAPERGGLYLLSSRDDGATWGEPQRIGEGTARHGSLAGSGRALVVAWDEAGSVRATISADEGARFSSPQRLSTEGARASHPIVVRTGTAYRVFWTESTDHGPATLRTAEVTGNPQGP
jgi:hypothetical protein